MEMGIRIVLLYTFAPSHFFYVIIIINSHICSYLFRGAEGYIYGRGEILLKYDENKYV